MSPFSIFRNGPTVFMIKDENGGVFRWETNTNDDFCIRIELNLYFYFRCTLGNPHRCTCAPNRVVSKVNQRNKKSATRPSPSPSTSAASTTDTVTDTNSNEEYFSEEVTESSLTEMEASIAAPAPPAAAPLASAALSTSGAASSQVSKLCKHVLFCLIKVLKVPKEHSLSYQTSLTNSEVTEVLMKLTTPPTWHPYIFTCGSWTKC